MLHPTRSAPAAPFSSPARCRSLAAALLAALAISLLPIACLRAEVTVDASLPSYRSVAGVSGNLNSVGSDTLNNLMSYWTEAFRAVYPNVNIQIEAKGSGTAPPALIEGTSQLGPMSRAMKPDEVDAFEKKFGYKPTAFKVAVDALAVFVHKDNPIAGLTLQQLDSIFSSTFKRGGQDITTWDQIGLADWAGKPISLYGRNTASGTYLYFKEHALQKGDYKTTVKEEPGSSGVVQGVASDLQGIGYSGIGYVTSNVRALPLGTAPDKLVQPTYENALNGTYPLARYLYIYVNKQPGHPLDTLVAQFLTFVLSKEGQSLVTKDGYFPLPAKAVQAMTDQLAN